MKYYIIQAVLYTLANIAGIILFTLPYHRPPHSFDKLNVDRDFRRVRVRLAGGGGGVDV